MKQVVRNLKDHFGGDRELPTITEGDAEDFKMHLIAEELASTTVHKRLQFARMFFRAAKKRELIVANPFAEVTAKAATRPDRQHFINAQETTRLLAVCNPTWRMIVALARYGGRMWTGKRKGSWFTPPRRPITRARVVAQSRSSAS